MKTCRLLIALSTLAVVLYGCSQRLTPNSPRTSDPRNESRPTVVATVPAEESTISGTVFVDQDGDGKRDPVNEAGISAGVTVTLADSKGPLQTTLTDPDGQYLFKVSGGESVLEGDFIVRIDAKTPESDFNEALAASFLATGDTEIKLSVEGDVSGIDFGFKPNAAGIIGDFRSGAVHSTGEDSKFWRKVFFMALKGRTQDGFDAPALQALLKQIEGMSFTDPYQFTPGNELEEAFEILSGHSRDPLDVLYKQVFVTELNIASGKGLVDPPGLQNVLVSWGESLIIDRRAASAEAEATRQRSGGGGTGGLLEPAATPTGDDEIVVAGKVFGLINNARGGGDVPQ